MRTGNFISEKAHDISVAHTYFCFLFAYFLIQRWLCEFITNGENVLNLDLHFVVIHTWEMLAVFVLPWILIQDKFSTKKLLKQT